jgi:phage tail sheath gpL-like
MPISFAQIPQNLKVPLYWVEVDPSMAGLPSINLRALIVGTATGGTAEMNITIPIGSQAMSSQFFGAGSEIDRMFKAYYANNFANEVWGLPVPASVNSEKATGEIKITSPCTAAGTIALYISGEHVPTNIATTDTTDDIANAIVDSINNWFGIGTIGNATSLPVTATMTPAVASASQAINAATWSNTPTGQATYTTTAPHNFTVGEQVQITGITPASYNGTFVAQTGTTGSTIVVPMLNNPGTYGSGGSAAGPPTAPSQVNLLCNWAGISGNDIPMMLNYYGSRGGDVTPVGLGITVDPFLTGGTGTPDFTTALNSLGNEPYEYVCMPYTDSDSLFVWEQEYGFSDTGRWGWERQLFGHIFSARRGVSTGSADNGYPDLVLWGETNNSGVVSVMAFENATQSPMFEAAAAYTAKAQRALVNDPARPLQSLSLNQIKLAPIHQRFDFPELNSLASNGLAIQMPGTDGQPMIAREQTTYQWNLYGATDDAYELVTTLATLAKLMRNQKAMVTSSFPRHKLANDGTKFGPGQAIVTPGIIKGALVAQYRNDEFNGLVENVELFKQFLMVERDSVDPNRANVLYPPDLINQLRIFAVLNQFRLQYGRGVDEAIIGPAPGPFLASSQANG